MSFQPRSSRPAAPWPKPCGRMAGRAAPLRARSPEEREAKGLDSLATYSAPLLADDAAAETADGTRTGGGVARRRTWRRKHRPAEILFESIGDIFPQLGDFLGRAAIG